MNGKATRKLTTAEVAQLHPDLSPDDVGKAIRRGKLEARRGKGRRYFIREENALRWLGIEKGVPEVV